MKGSSGFPVGKIATPVWLVGHMGDKDLYAQILGIGSPWQVEAVDLRLHASEIHIVVGLARGKHAAVPLYILESSVAVVPGALKPRMTLKLWDTDPTAPAPTRHYWVMSFRTRPRRGPSPRFSAPGNHD